METQIQAIARLLVSMYAFFLFSESFRRRHEIELFYQIAVINAGLGFWNCFLFLYYSLDAPEAVYLVSQWGFASVNATIFGFFFFTCRLVYGKKYDKPLAVLAVLPVLSSVLSVTSSFQSTFLAGHAGFTYLPLRELAIRFGPWYKIHSISGYLFIAVSLVLLVIRSVKSKIKNRPVILLLTVSIFLFSAVLFLANFTALKSVVQLYSFLAHLFCISVFYWATFLDEDGSVIYFGKHRFYDTVGMPVLVFNGLQELVHLNEDARRFFADIQFPVEMYLKFEKLLDGGRFSRIDVGAEPEDGQSFFIKDIANGQITYCRQNDIVNARRRRIGFSVILYNLQTVNAMIQGLEKRAYVDTLCRCFNRNCFEQRKGEIIDTAARPLSLIIADVDNLKSVNDRYGHKAGDEYLSACVRILRKVSRSGDTLFRIGGDEFALFLPGTDEAGSERVQKAAADELSALRMGFPCSLSIGCSIVGEGDVDFERHFKMADDDMYRKKHAKKHP